MMQFILFYYALANVCGFEIDRIFFKIMNTMGTGVTFFLTPLLLPNLTGLNWAATGDAERT
jgi:hypothetical protein